MSGRGKVDCAHPVLQASKIDIAQAIVRNRHEPGMADIIG
jgi:hypothetical protein